MKNKSTKGASGKDKAGQRRLRQAESLRDNLKKRKQQIRDRQEGKKGDTEA